MFQLFRILNEVSVVVPDDDVNFFSHFSLKKFLSIPILNTRIMHLRELQIYTRVEAGANSLIQIDFINSEIENTEVVLTRSCLIRQNS